MACLVSCTALAVLLCMPLVSGFNITTFFWEHAEFTTFNNLLTATNVAGEINNRSSLTILALSNSLMQPFISSFGGNLPTLQVSDVLRYHVLLEYLDWDRLLQMTNSGTLVTTLYQTTGRAPNNMGAVNITTVNNGQIHIGMPVPDAGFNATIIGLVDKFPYTISIVRISSVLIPYGFDLSASPAPAPVGINVTDVLVKAKNFNFLISLMEASGVVSDFESDQAGAGITIFAPTDDAFSALNPETLQGLTAEKKAVILKYHVLLSYYPLGSLQTIVNPVQPTLATEDMGAGSYTLNITRMNGIVAVNTGIVQAPVTETVFDQKPLAVFAVPKVLLPREIFGANSPPTSSPVATPLPSPNVTPVSSVASPSPSPLNSGSPTPQIQHAPTPATASTPVAISPSHAAASPLVAVTPSHAHPPAAASPLVAVTPSHAHPPAAASPLVAVTPLLAPTEPTSSPIPSMAPSIVPPSLSPTTSVSPSTVPTTPSTPPSTVPFSSPAASPSSFPPSDVGLTGETPSPSPADIGEETSRSIATFIVGRAILSITCALVMCLLMENI